MSKLKMSDFTWSEILGDPALNRLARRLNTRHLSMSEDDIMTIINNVASALKVREDRLT